MKLLACPLLLGGCLTDGSIPVGGGSGNGILRGTVVRAEDPDQPFPAARVTLRAPEGLSLQQRSDDQGNWQFSNVPDGQLDVTFEGPEPGTYLPVRVNVRTEYASFSTIAVALEPAHMSVPDVTAVAVTPAQNTVHVGSTIHFKATITGGSPLRKVPTWVVEGGIGSISAKGEFVALRRGSGVVRAYAGAAAGSALVTVADAP